MTGVDISYDLYVRHVGAALEFYVDALGGVEICRECLLDGQILQVEVAFGGYVVNLIERPDQPVDDNDPLPCPPSFLLECENPDRILKRALAAGARLEAEPPRAVVRDAAGYQWTIVGRGPVTGGADLAG